MQKIAGRAFTGIVFIALIMLLVGCASNMYVQSARISINNLNDYQRAKEQLLEGTIHTPMDPQVWYLLGTVYFELADFDSMLYAFAETQELTEAHNSEIERIKNEAWRLTFNQAVIPFNQQDFPAAIELFEQAMRISPDNYDTRKFVAVCMIQTQEYERAEEYLLDAQQSNDESAVDVDLHFSLLNVYWLQEQWENVRDEAGFILEMPDTLLNEAQVINAIERKAVAYVNLDDLESAVALWDNAIAQNPEEANYYFNKARLLEQLDNDEEAIICYQSVLTYSPDDEQARRRLANLLLGQQRWEEIVDALVPWLFPDGTIEPITPTVTEVTAWHMLYAALVNADRMEEAQIVFDIKESLE